MIGRVVAAAGGSAVAAALSVFAARERSHARYWRAVAELELNVREPGLFFAYDVTSPARGRSFADFTALLERRFNQSRAGAVTPARGLPVTGC